MAKQKKEKKSLFLVEKKGEKDENAKSIHVRRGVTRVTLFEATGLEGYGKWKIVSTRVATPKEEEMLRKSRALVDGEKPHRRGK